MSKREGVVSQDLLLSDLRTFTKPGELCSRLREQLRQKAERKSFAHRLQMDGLVPQESTPTPLRQKVLFSCAPRTEPVGEAHGFDGRHAVDCIRVMNANAGGRVTCLPQFLSRPSLTYCRQIFVDSRTRSLAQQESGSLTGIVDSRNLNAA